MKRHFFKSAVVLPSNDTLQVITGGWIWITPSAQEPLSFPTMRFTCQNGFTVSQKTAHPPRFIASKFGRVHNPSRRDQLISGESTFRFMKQRNPIIDRCEVLNFKETRVKGEMLHNIEIRVNGCCKHQKVDELLKFGHLPRNRPR